MQKQIYFNEYNLLMGSGGIVYLPFVSGILSACLKTNKKISENIRVMDFIFRPDTYENIINLYDNPSIVAFSISMWNEQLSLKVAEGIKEKFPNSYIIFGGAQCPHNPHDYMMKYGFIDACVRAEGEEAFVLLCESVILNSDKSNIPNLSYRNKFNSIISNTKSPEYDRTLDLFPSPYLTGEFEYLLNKPDHKLQAIIETNRGCPFLCTFCYWGKGGSTTKYRFRDIKTIFEEIDYLAQRKVEYIFNADSNFGMHERDYDIALKLVEAKSKYGYPEKFRTCWGKNTSERIFKIASILQYHNLDKGVTLARQSNSNEVLKNIKRENIKLETYSILEQKFNQLQVPIYAELILGLPGETYDSWKIGIEQMLNSGLNNQLFVYQAEVYPNTELGSEEYQSKFKIKTHKIKLNEIHCSPRPIGWTSEYQYIVIQTETMTVNDWRNMTIYAIITMLLHSMKAGIYIISFLRDFTQLNYSDIFQIFINSKSNIIKKFITLCYEYTDKLLAGEGRGLYIPEYSDVYLEIEEVLLIEVCKNKQEFYAEIKEIYSNYINNSISSYWNEVLKFQELSIPYFTENEITLNFDFNTSIPDYCVSIFNNKNLQLIEKFQTLKYIIPVYINFQEFVKRQIIWSRKSGTILLRSDLEIKIRENNVINYSLKDIKREKTFQISLFDPNNRQRFEKFNSLESK